MTANSLVNAWEWSSLFELHTVVYRLALKAIFEPKSSTLVYRVRQSSMLSWISYQTLWCPRSVLGLCLKHAAFVAPQTSVYTWRWPIDDNNDDEQWRWVLITRFSLHCDQTVGPLEAMAINCRRNILQYSVAVGFFANVLLVSGTLCQRLYCKY